MSDPLSRRTARAFIRTPFRGEIRLQYGRDEVMATETADFSSGGIFVHAKRPQPVGTLVRFAMPVLGGARTVTGYGEVAWIRVRDDPKVGPAGMGIQFRYMDEPGETWLREHEAQVQAQAQAEAVLKPPPSAAVAPPEGGRAAGERALPLVRPKPPARPSATDPSLWPPDRVAESAAAWEADDVFPPPPEIESPDLERPFSGSLEDEGEEPAHGRRLRPLLVGAAGLLLVAVALLARGPITRWLTGGPETAKPPKAAAAATKPRGGDTRSQAASVPSASTKPAPPAALPAATAVAEVTPPPPVAPLSTASNGPLTRVASITYGSVPGETIVVLAGDGQILEERVTRQRLGGPEPRELLRIAGIVAPYEPAVIPVGTGELTRIRTGHHPGAGGGELYVVFDLPGPRAGVHRLDFQPTGLRVYLRRLN